MTTTSKPASPEQKSKPKNLVARRFRNVACAAGLLLAPFFGWYGYSDAVTQEKNFNKTSAQQAKDIGKCIEFVGDHTENDKQKLKIKFSDISDEGKKACGFSEKIELFADEWQVKQRAESALPEYGDHEIASVTVDARVVLSSVDNLRRTQQDLQNAAKNLNDVSIAVETAVAAILGGGVLGLAAGSIVTLRTNP